MPLFTLAGTAVATAALGAAAAGTVGFTLVAGATAFALQAGAMYGVNMLVQNMAGRNTAPETNTPTGPGFSVQESVGSGADFPRSFPLGYRVVLGSMVYANTWGTVDKNKNGYFTQVIALSDLPLKAGADGLVGLWVNDKLCTIDWETEHAGGRGHPVPEYYGKNIDESGQSDHLWIKFYDGTQTTADSFLVDTVSTDAHPYTNDRIGKGVAYAVVTARLNDTLFTSFPQIKFELNGIPLYDISKDSTKGGDGDHRFDNPATWGGDGDFLPMVQAYNLLRGFYYDGEWLYGLQKMTEARLPAAAWISQIEKCREEVEDDVEDTPTMAPRYRSSMEVMVNNELGTTLEALLRACQGRMSESGGFYEPFIGEPDDPVATFTDLDIISTEEQTFTPFFGLANTINGVIAKYPSPNDGWNTKVAPPVYRTDLESLSGGRRLLSDISFDTVPYARQVQQLMQESLQEAQRARKHTFELPARFGKYKPGQILSWSSDRNGYEDKRFRIEGMIDKPNLNVVVDLIEIDPNDYDWQTSTDYTPPVYSPSDPGYNPVDEQAIAGWNAFGVTVTDETGAIKRPGIRVEWDTGDLGDVQGVQIQVRKAAQPEVTIIDTVALDLTLGYTILTAQAILSATDYEVRGKFVAPPTRLTSWTSWTPVTTPDHRFEFADLSELLNDALVIQVRAELEELRTTLEQVAASAMDRVGGEWARKETQRRSLKIVETNLSAEIDVVSTVATATDAALASLAITVAAHTTGIADNAASIAINATAITTLDSAVSVLETTVSAHTTSIGDLEDDVTANTASITTNASAITTINGSLSTLTATVSSHTTTLSTQGATLTSLSATVSTQASTITSLSGSLSSLTSTVSSHTTSISSLTASVSTNASAITGINGALSAQYTITLNANNAISGIKLYQGSTLSAFIVSVDIFQVWKSGFTAIPVFEINNVNGVSAMTFKGNFFADGTIYARNIVADNINTDHLQLQSATMFIWAVGDDITGEVGKRLSVNKVLATFTTDIVEGDCLVMFDSDVTTQKNGGSNSDTLTLEFRQGSTVIFERIFRCTVTDNDARIRYPVAFKRGVSLTPGEDQVFSVVITQSNFDNGQSIMLAPTLTLVEGKR